MSDAAAVVLMFGIVAYAVFGGADFGAGFWDLIAGGAERGERPRALVDHSIGPVWEANHVWLIFSLVVLWTAFPEAFASITLTLFVPLTIAALGIVLRGSSFAFRKSVFRTRDQRNFGAAFAIASVIVRTAWARSRARSPRAAYRREARRATRGRVGSTRARSWAACSPSPSGPILAAVYLIWDARRLENADLVDYFSRRAIAAAVVTGAVAFAGIFVLRSDARYVFDGLTSRALPLVIVSALCGAGSLVLLLRHAHRYARFLSIGAVATVVAAWGVAQYPYMLPTSLKLSQAAAPSPTLTAVLIVFGIAAVIILPSLALLYVLDQRSLLPAEGGDSLLTRETT